MWEMKDVMLGEKKIFSELKLVHLQEQYQYYS